MCSYKKKSVVNIMTYNGYNIEETVGHSFLNKISRNCISDKQILLILRNCVCFWYTRNTRML